MHASIAFTVARLRATCPLCILREKDTCCFAVGKMVQTKNHIPSPRSLLNPKARVDMSMKHCRTIPTQYVQIEQHMSITAGMLCKVPKPLLVFEHFPSSNHKYHLLSANSEKPSKMLKTDMRSYS